jgi:hypothetical protein
VEKNTCTEKKKFHSWAKYTHFGAILTKKFCQQVCWEKSLCCMMLEKIIFAVIFLAI